MVRRLKTDKKQPRGLDPETVRPHASVTTHVARVCGCSWGKDDRECACDIEVNAVEAWACWSSRRVKPGEDTPLGRDVALYRKALATMSDADVGVLYRAYAVGVPAEVGHLLTALGGREIVALAPDTERVAQHAAKLTRERRPFGATRAIGKVVEACPHPHPRNKRGERVCLDGPRFIGESWTADETVRRDVAPVEPWEAAFDLLVRDQASEARREGETKESRAARVLTARHAREAAEKAVSQEAFQILVQASKPFLAALRKVQREADGLQRPEPVEWNGPAPEGE